MVLWLVVDTLNVDCILIDCTRLKVLYCSAHKLISQRVEGCILGFNEMQG